MLFIVCRVNFEFWKNPTSAVLRRELLRACACFVFVLAVSSTVEFAFSSRCCLGNVLPLVLEHDVFAFISRSRWNDKSNTCQIPLFVYKIVHRTWLVADVCGGERQFFALL